MINHPNPEQWLWDALIRSSASVTALSVSDDRTDVTLSVIGDDGTTHDTTLSIKHFGLVKPSTVRNLSVGLHPPLVVADKVSPETVQVLRETGRSWISYRPLASGLRGELLLEDRVVALQKLPGGAVVQEKKAGPGRPGNASSRVLQELLWRGTATQRDLAQATGVSQARVSQVLNDPATTSLMSPSAGHPARWQVKDVGGLIDHWLENHRPLRGVPTHWYSLEQLRGQVGTALTALQPDHGTAGAWVSGAMAADVLAPWSVPRAALIYTSSTRGLAGAGFVPSQADEATLKLVVTRDKAVSPSDASRRVIARLTRLDPGWPIADPLVILWDLLHSDDTDAGQAAHHLREALVKQLGSVDAR